MKSQASEMDIEVASVSSTRITQAINTLSASHNAPSNGTHADANAECKLRGWPWS